MDDDLKKKYLNTKKINDTCIEKKKRILCVKRLIKKEIINIKQYTSTLVGLNFFFFSYH